MWRILQYSKPDDFVLSTGKTTEVREFVRMAFKVLGIEIEFKGKGEKEEGFIFKIESSEFTHLKVGQKVVAIDPRYYRPTEVDLLIGDSSKAQKELGWKAQTGLDDLIAEMVLRDYEKHKNF